MEPQVRNARTVMIQSNRCRFGWHKWRVHEGITSGLKKCRRCGVVARYGPAMVPPPIPRNNDDLNELLEQTERLPVCEAGPLGTGWPS